MTPHQKKLHDFLWERRGGVTPSYEEMCDHLGLKSKSGITRLVTSLEEIGLVRRPDGQRARRLEVMPPPGALATVPINELAAEIARRGWVAMPRPLSAAEIQETMGG